MVHRGTGNWQTRVETVDARRLLAKQRRQLTQDKRTRKARFQELLVLLNQHSNGILEVHKKESGSSSLMIHIWTEMLPSESPPLLEITQGEAYSPKWAKRRARSGSIGNEAPSRRKGRGRSNFLSEKAVGKKKSHPRSPRSKAASMENSKADVTWLSTPLLCKSHFFGGKCMVGKKGGCRFVHYSSQFKTISVALNGKRAPDRVKQELILSEHAVSPPGEGYSRGSSTHLGAMAMVYYLPVELTENGSWNEQIRNALLRNGIDFSTIVYVAFDNVLLFDRCRGGLIVSEEEMSLIAGSVDTGGDASIVVGLPCPILEHILAFCPEATVAAACRVCRVWYDEIGQKSPNLWRALLERRNWPTSFRDEAGADGEGSNRTLQILKNDFLHHYAVVRDAAAIKKGLEALFSQTKRVQGVTSNGKEMCYQDFSTRQHAPGFPNCCVSVQVLSSNQILAAYTFDCSLRLFEASPRAGGDELVCKEILSRSVDPYHNTKKRRCRLVAMELDDESIGCLCHVMADKVDAEAYILVVLGRGDFLVRDSGEPAGRLDRTGYNVIDIGAAVLDYLLSHREALLVDFIGRDGEIGKVEVLVSQTMAACGYGRFMLEASISIPGFDLDEDDLDEDDLDEDDDRNHTMELLYRRLFLFSVRAGAVVWMGESNPPTEQLRPREEEMTLSCLRQPLGGYSSACCVAVRSSTSSIVVADIEPSGHVQRPYLLEASTSVPSLQGWKTAPAVPSSFVITSTDFVAAHTLLRSVDDQVQERKTVISFYPRIPVVGPPGHSTLFLSGDLEALRMVLYRDQYVVLLCRAYETPRADKHDQENNVSGEDQRRRSIHAAVIHVPFRHEMERVCLIEGVCEDLSEIPHISSSTNGDTLGVGLSWKGVVMAGRDVRGAVGSRVIEQDQSNTKYTRKKTKRRSNKGSKKDGFARGMSLRG